VRKDFKLVCSDERARVQRARVDLQHDNDGSVLLRGDWSAIQGARIVHHFGRHQSVRQRCLSSRGFREFDSGGGVWRSGHRLLGRHPAQKQLGHPGHAVDSHGFTGHRVEPEYQPHYVVYLSGPLLLLRSRIPACSNEQTPGAPQPQIQDHR